MINYPSLWIFNLFYKKIRQLIYLLQESAAVQIILEAGLLKDQDEHELEEKIGHSNVKEIRLICSYLHESFIADPTLAKLVHFQVSCFNFIIKKLQKSNLNNLS